MPIISNGIQINLTAKDEASPALNQVKKSVEGVDSATTKASQGFDSSAFGSGVSINAWMQIAQAVFKAGQEIYEFAKQGAQLQLVEYRFDRLAQSIGTTSDVLLNDLRDATHGMYSDSELMQSALDFMSLGLAKNHDEAIRLATVASGLNMNMNQLVLTLTNMTTMRFDAIGMRVDGFKDKVKALEAAGYSAEAAFKEAFLKQAEEQLKTVGNAADTAAGEFMKMEADWKNFTDSMKKGALEAVIPLIRNMNDLRDTTNKQKEAFHELIEAGVVPAWKETDFWRQRNEALILQLERGKEMTKFYSQQIQANTIAQTENAAAVQLTEAQVKELTKTNQAYLSSVGSLTNEIQKFSEKSISLRDEQDNLLAKKQALITQGYAPESQALQDINNKLADNEAAQRKNADEAELAGRRRILSMLEQQLAIDGLDARETEYLLSKGLEWGIYSQDAVDAMRKAQAEVAALESKFNALPTEHTFTVNIQTTGALPGFNPQALPGGYGYQGAGYAEGGIATGPQSGHMELLHGTEAVIPLQGGSVPVQMISNGGQSMAGDIYITLSVNSPVSIMDENKTNNVLLPLIVDGIKTAQRQGLIQ